MNPAITQEQILAMAPELIVLFGAFLILAVDMVQRLSAPPSGPRPVLRWVAALSLVAAVICLACSGPAEQAPMAGVLAADALSVVARGLLIAIALLSLIVGSGVSQKLGLEHGEYFALLLFATAGMMFFAGSENLIFTFVALEMFSLCMYVMAGFNRRLASNREAALKYFLLGAYAAAFFLFGMALVYGAVGSVDYLSIAEAYGSVAADSARSRLLTGGLLLVAVAFAFKVGLAPFHLWVPDTYEGAPTPVTAFLSAGAKAAGFIALLRLCSFLPLNRPEFAMVIAFLAVLTMTVANAAALRQTSLKRLLAYSSISHSGYAMLGLAGGSGEAISSVVLYVVVYAVMNFCAFGLLIALERGQKDAAAGRSMTLNDLAGLGFEKPFYGLCMAVAMFSMAGLPPTAGFIAKFAIFKSALDGGMVLAVIFAALNSVVAAAYYLRVLVIMYMKPREGSATPELGFGLGLVVAFCAALLLIYGVLPGGIFAVSANAIVGIP